MSTSKLFVTNEATGYILRPMPVEVEEMPMGMATNAVYILEDETTYEDPYGELVEMPMPGQERRDQRRHARPAGAEVGDEAERNQKRADDNGRPDHVGLLLACTFKIDGLPHPISGNVAVSCHCSHDATVMWPL